jgi:DNA modification methylase
MPVVNRFNRLTSKEWLPFQKSWFKFESDEKMYTDYVRFFCKAEPCDEVVFYYGPDFKGFNQVCKEQQLIATQDVKSPAIQYVFIDLRESLSLIQNVDHYYNIINGVTEMCTKINTAIVHRRFITILAQNQYVGNQYQSYAYDIGYRLAGLWSLKDEKIACLPTFNDEQEKNSGHFETSNHVFYTLNFRKDENSQGVTNQGFTELFNHNIEGREKVKYKSKLPQWYILKPQPRKKNEILHPAKYPEELVKLHLDVFTSENDNVFDPMSGTGSTLVAALNHGRNGFGIELSEYFAQIAIERCENIINPINPDLFRTAPKQSFKLINKDALQINAADFPTIQYMITSPPYWDMLNMKGAENQAKRVEKGLQTNYSDSKEDLGNISDYSAFNQLLMDVYDNVLDIVPSGAHFTIVVKNIKKKGKNYPFAWDITRYLSSKMIVLPETFWCQDDINLAPYGYGNTFVSNTFHQYCLNFRKP